MLRIKGSPKNWKLDSSEDPKLEELADGGIPEAVEDVDGRSLRCGHVFHPLCLEPWLERHDTCPLCKRRAKPRRVKGRKAGDDVAVVRLVWFRSGDLRLDDHPALASACEDEDACIVPVFVLSPDSEEGGGPSPLTLITADHGNSYASILRV